MKKGNKIKNIILTAGIIFGVFPLLIFIMLNFGPVNLLITSAASKFMSAKFNTEISLSHFFISPFRRSIELEKFFVADPKNDTLLSAENIYINLDGFNINKLDFNFSKVLLEDVTLKLKKDSAGIANYDFLSEGEKDTLKIKTDSLPTPFNIKVADIELKNINFLYSTVLEPSKNKHEMNFDDLDLKNLCLKAKNFSINQDLEIKLNLIKLKAEEKCGLKLQNLSSKIDVSQSGILLDNMILTTSKSDICAEKLHFIYSDFEDFSSFLDSVKIEASILKKSVLSLDDIGHFVSDIYGFGLNPEIETEVSGAVNNLRIKKLNLKLSDTTNISLKCSLKNVSNMEHFCYNLDTLKVTASMYDITKLHEQGKKSVPLVELPDFINELGIVRLNAVSGGSLKNLCLKAVINSRLGDVITDLKINSTNKETALFGFVDAGNLDLATITDDRETFGKFSAKIDTINLKIPSKGNMHGKISGKVDSIGLLGYYYKNVKIKGNFTDKLFNGFLEIKDNCLDLDFSGIADMDKDMRFNFELDVNHADLKNTNILSDSVDNIKFSLKADFTGNSPDNFNGLLKLSKPLEFQRDTNVLTLKEFQLKSFIDSYRNNFANRKYILNSSYLDAQLRGLIRSEQIIMILSHFAYMVFPSLDYETDENQKIKNPKAKRKRYKFDDPEFFQNYNSRFKFHAKLKDTKELTDFFAPEFSIANGTYLDFDMNITRATTFFTFNSEKISYEDYSISDLNIEGSAKHDTLEVSLDTKQITMFDEEIETPHAEFFAKNDTARIALNWKNSGLPKSDIKGDLYISKNKIANKFPYLNFRFRKSEFNLYDTDFKILPSEISVDSTSIDINNLRIAISKIGESEDNYDFTINGKVSEDASDKLDIIISDFDLELLHRIIPDITLSGKFDGKFSVSKVYASKDGGMPVVEVHAESEKMNVEGINLKYFLAEARLNEGDSIIHLNMRTLKRKNDTIKAISVGGTYDFKSETADLSLYINELQLNYFKKFFENYLQTSKYSLLTGYAKVTGKLNDPQIKAALTLHGGYFKIQYLGTQYDLSDSMSISLDNKMIELSKTKFYSGRGTGIAYLEGKLNHRNFNNFNMNVSLTCKNFMFLNAKETDSSAFWGKAYASGNIKITGDPTSMINIDARVKTDKNTQVFLPLYMAGEVSEDWDFITFNNPTQNNEIHRQQADLSDIRMNFNVEVTPDAEVQVIMDETTGNILKASAKGDLRLDITGSGDFNMYGTLNIVKGDYLFTMQHMLSKKFEIVKGGSLSWNGDPMDAIVDLSASYRLRKVNLFNLMADQSYKDKKVPVRCILNMKGDLMQPKLSFAVKVEENSDVVQGQLDNLDEGNINKQAMSLLLLNQFQPLPGLKSSENSMFSDINPGELVSNQLNHWLSDISDKVDVGVNYQMGDGNSSGEFDVAVSTQLLDDRVTVSTNFGVGGNSNNPASTRTNNVVGEVEVDVNLNKTGGIKLKVYNKANDDELDQAPYVQGVGVIFKRDFNRFNIFNRRKKKKN